MSPSRASQIITPKSLQPYAHNPFLACLMVPPLSPRADFRHWALILLWLSGTVGLYFPHLFNFVILPCGSTLPSDSYIDTTKGCSTADTCSSSLSISLPPLMKTNSIALLDPLKDKAPLKLPCLHLKACSCQL